MTDTPDPDGTRVDVEAIKARLDEAVEDWMWREQTDDTIAGWGAHMGQMLYRLPIDGQTRDMQASIEAMVADLAALLARLTEVEAERDQARADAADTMGGQRVARLHETYGSQIAAAFEAEAVAITRAESAEARVAAVEALVPAECWVLRVPATGPVCTDMIGGGVPSGAKWTEEMCCVPCRLRAAFAHATPQPRPDATESPERAERGEKAPGCQSDGSGALAGAEGVGDE